MNDCKYATRGLASRGDVGQALSGQPCTRALKVSRCVQKVSVVPKWTRVPAPMP